MIKRSLLAFFFALFYSASEGQSTYNPYLCVDSSQINIYFPCNKKDYEPVCGCDGKSYRNDCAAVHWGGLVNFTWTPGTCTNFGIDFNPNVIVPFSPLNDHGTLSIYSKIGPVTATIQIYDVYARLWYRQEVILPAGFPIYPPIDINMNNYEAGLYYLFVIINGEAQYVKLMKANIL